MKKPKGGLVDLFPHLAEQIRQNANKAERQKNWRIITLPPPVDPMHFYDVYTLGQADELSYVYNSLQASLGRSIRKCLVQFLKSLVGSKPTLEHYGPYFSDDRLIWTITAGDDFTTTDEVSVQFAIHDYMELDLTMDGSQPRYKVEAHIEGHLNKRSYQASHRLEVLAQFMRLSQVLNLLTFAEIVTIRMGKSIQARQIEQTFQSLPIKGSLSHEWYSGNGMVDEFKIEFPITSTPAYPA